jgi:hypothetical protein
MPGYGAAGDRLSIRRVFCTEGFSHFVSSMTAPVASGWSGCRVGLSPTGKRRLSTAHTRNGRRHQKTPGSMATAFEIRFWEAKYLEKTRLPNAFTSHRNLRCRTPPQARVARDRNSLRAADCPDLAQDGRDVIADSLLGNLQPGRELDVS